MTSEKFESSFVNSKVELINFIRNLAEESRKPDSNWENLEIHLFLEAMAGWLSDMDGYYTNKGLPAPTNQTWKTFAEMLASARYYE